MNTKPISSRASAGFTIVEMLVATSVLVLLVVMVAQMLNGAVMSTNIGRKSIDSDTQARLIFDRMAIYFDKMLKRQDVDYIFYKNYVPPGTTSTLGVNDAMFFYSEVPSYYDDVNVSGSSQNPVALVGYRVDWQNPYYGQGIPVLERLSKGLTWDGITSGTAVAGSPVFLTSTGGGVPLAATRLDGNWGSIGTASDDPPYDGNSANDPDYHVLSDRVFRMEIAFLLNDGTISAVPIIDPNLSPPGAQVSGTASVNKVNPAQTSEPLPTSGTGQGFAVGSRWFAKTASGPGGQNECRGFICTSNASGTAIWNNIGIQDVSAVIVTIAVLDDTSRKLIAGSNAGTEYQNLSSLFSDLSSPSNGAISQTKLMAPMWSGMINSGTFAQTAGIPSTAASQVRVYQRYFYLNQLQ